MNRTTQTGQNRIRAAIAHIDRRFTELEPALLSFMSRDVAGQPDFAYTMGEMKALTELACILMGLVEEADQ